MFTSRKTILGIDIQKNVVRYCTLHKGRWLYGEKLAQGNFFKDNRLKNKQELVKIIHDICKETHSRAPHVVISALNSKLLIKQIPLQKMETEKEIREFLFFELGESIQLPFENPIFDLLILDRPNQKQKKEKKTKKMKKEQASSGDLEQVKVKTVKRNRFAVNGNVPVLITSEPLLEEIGDVILDGGGNLAGVDFSALAYTSILKREIEWGQCFALVEIDSGEATITIFEKLVPVYVQYEDYNQINWRFQEVDGQIIPDFKDEAEAVTQLGETIQNIIRYFETDISEGGKVSKIYLVGGHPRLKKEVSDVIQSKNDIPVSVLTSALKLKKLLQIPPRFLLAACLALKEV